MKRSSTALFDIGTGGMVRAPEKRKWYDKNMTEQSIQQQICSDRASHLRRLLHPLKAGDLVKKERKRYVWRLHSRLDHARKHCKESPTIEEERLHTANFKPSTMMSQRDQHRQYRQNHLRSHCRTGQR